MLVLAVIEPLPAVGKFEIEPQPQQCGIGLAQMTFPGAAALEHRFGDLLHEIQGSVHQPLGKCVAVDSGKPLRLRQQPVQQFAAAGKDDQVFGHGFSQFEVGSGI